MTCANTCFALLDDSRAGPDRASSRLYTDFVRLLAAPDVADLAAWSTALDAALAQGCHAVLLADYEWGARAMGVPALAGAQPAQLAALLFRQCARMTVAEVDAWLAARSGAAAGVYALRASVDWRQFEAAIAHIHAAIRDGESYQVNYSYRLGFQAHGSPLALYRKLRARQPVPYGALIELPGAPAPRYVLSLSPELFVRKTGAALIAQPMKGTAALPADAADHAAAAARLAADPKTRAENLMIVDLLRNDLGRVARTGSVAVPKLFDVETHGSVLQMVSTIRAELRDGLGLADVLQALFPCGSVTGAPKHRSMQIIAALETAPRGLYTGAIGWADGQGDCCLSVAIRTLLLGARGDGTYCGELGVGAGIVIDSRAADEYAECRLKAEFLTGLGAGFALFETLYATREEGVRHLTRHLARLAASAAELGFVCDAARIAAALAARAAELPPGTPCRLRLQLEYSGEFALTHAPLAALVPGPIKVGCTTAAASAPPALLRHKTTLRSAYDAAMAAAEAGGKFDLLFFNAAGELTEGARSNVFVRLDGCWYTPPLAAGVLPGVMRGVLLDDPQWGARERRLTRADLARAERIVLCNALRGVLEARLALDSE
ncbi:MAG: chorismate-binding protein [Rhodocyclaceae bacterium]|nr:chorismate-binding protein [Rhodocyclaceae bacterium]